MNEHKFIDVTVIEPKLKHPTIFDAFDNIDSGEAIVIHNDHDPKPLYYQLLGERGNCFSWLYLAEGPEIWQVQIKKNLESIGRETVGEIAAKDIRKAELFKKLGLDFCCGGNKTLEDACLDKGIDVLDVRKKLKDVETTTERHDYYSWSLTFMIDYIMTIHHDYVKRAAPQLKELSEKVVAHHADNIPNLELVRKVISQLICELSTHMKKEEQILFPYIKELERDNGTMGKGDMPIQDLIQIMEMDHQLSGDLLQELHRLTDDYSELIGSCNSVRFLMKKLREFEDDLHLHIHLENNILFPKAIKLEKSLKA